MKTIATPESWRIARGPKLFADLVSKTIVLDENVFQPINVSLKDATNILKSSMPEAIVVDCKWAFPKQRRQGQQLHTIPEAYIIPKGKNDFQKARSIIPCTRHWLRKLHRGVGRLLADIAE